MTWKTSGMMAGGIIAYLEELFRGAKAIRESCEEMYSDETDEYIIRIAKEEEEEALKDADLAMPLT